MHAVPTAASSTTCSPCAWSTSSKSATPNSSGLNLTFECREGILKHCSVRNARELGRAGRALHQPPQPGLEAQIANLADEIAYNNHDVDDGIRAQLVDLRELREVRLFRRQYDAVVAQYPDLGERRLVHEIIRRMINFIVIDLIRTTQSRLDEAHPHSIDDVRALSKPLVGLSDTAREEHTELMEFLRERLYKHYKVLRMTSKARRVPQGAVRGVLRGRKSHAARAPRPRAAVRGHPGGLRAAPALWRITSRG